MLLVLMLATFYSHQGQCNKLTAPEDWTRSGEIMNFNPDNLFDFINGASGLFINYNFQQLQVTEYQNGEEMVRVEVYDHGDAVQAFGMYSQERSEDMPFVKIGAQGYTIETILNFVKGKYYVKLNYYGEKDARESLVTVARSISSQLEGTDSLPAALKYFPGENKIENSEQFIAQSFMGLSFINRVFTATYQGKDKNYLLFIHEADPDQIEQELLEYYKFAKKPRGKVKPGKHTIADPYNGPMTMIWEGSLLYGINGVNDKKQAQQIMEKFSERVR